MAAKEADYMEFPDFSEFRNTLTEEQLKQIMPLDNLAHYIIQEPRSPENISAFLSDFARRIFMENVRATCDLLELYHEWLRGCLE